MPFELKMPKLGESVTEGTIGKWLKQPGDKVNKYDLLVEVQTDKVNTEIPSPVAGTLKEVKVEEGQTVPIGTLLAVFDTADGEAAASAPQPSAAPQSAPQQPQAAAPQAPKPSQPAGDPPASGRAPSARGPSAPEGASATPPRAASPPPQSPSPRPAPAAAATAAAERPDLSDIRATPAVRKLASEQGIDIS